MLLPIKAFSYMFKFGFRSLAIFFFQQNFGLSVAEDKHRNLWIHTLSELSTLMSFQSWTEGLKTSAQPWFVWFGFVLLFLKCNFYCSLFPFRNALLFPVPASTKKWCAKRSITPNIIYYVLTACLVQ